MINRLFSSVITLLIVLVITTISFAGESDFRKANWGMSKKQVKATENLEVAYEKENYIGYKTKVLDRNVLLFYIFAQDKLVRAKYTLADEHSNKNEYINDYDAFKTTLTKKYGSPIEDETLWLNNLYKDDYQDWGLAISIRHLAYFSKWETDLTKIAAVLSGDNYTIDCSVEYYSKKLKYLEEEAKENKSMSDL